MGAGAIKKHGRLEKGKGRDAGQKLGCRKIKGRRQGRGAIRKRQRRRARTGRLEMGEDRGASNELEGRKQAGIGVAGLGRGLAARKCWGSHGRSGFWGGQEKRAAGLLQFAGPGLPQCLVFVMVGFEGSGRPGFCPGVLGARRGPAMRPLH